MKKKLLIMIFMVFPFLLCSCGESLEVRDRAFIHGIGVSKKNGITVCLRISDNSGGSEAFTGTGRTISEAIDDAEKTQGKDFFAGHTELVVIESCDSQDVLRQLIDTNISPGCIVVYNDDPIRFAQENDTIEVLDMLNTAVRNKKVREINICDVVNGRGGV